MGQSSMNMITTKDGVELYYKDWGPKDGPVVTLSHGWPLSSDSWEGTAFFLANEGFRVVAHDRRGHGRSSQPWEGNDMDHYADDLATVVDALALKDISMFGRSEEHTSELQSLMRISYAVFCLKKKKKTQIRPKYVRRRQRQHRHTPRTTNNISQQQ